MSSSSRSPVERQADALIEEIGRKVEQARLEALAAAAREAEAIRQRARSKARRQLRRAIDEMRATQGQRLSQSKAELETERSQRVSASSLDALLLAWPLLGEAIQRRWADAAARAQWMDAQLERASVRFGPSTWRIRHPAAWQDAEVTALRRALARQGVAGATLQADTTLATGLIVEAAGARLDSSPQALLADRPAVEASLLAEMASAATRGSPDE